MVYLHRIQALAPNRSGMTLPTVTGSNTQRKPGAIKMKTILSLVATCALSAFAQPVTTQVSDTVYNQDGSLFNGSLTVSLTSGSVASGGVSVIRSLPRKTIDRESG